MKWFVIALVCLGAIAASGNSLKAKEIPGPVMSAFQKAFPRAEDVRWEMENGNYEVDFEAKEVDMTLVISPSGAVLEKATKIKTADLPAGTKENLKAKYPGFSIQEVEKVEKNGTVEYEMDLIKKMEVISDAGGNVVRESDEEEVGDDDGDKEPRDDDGGNR